MATSGLSITGGAQRIVVTCQRLCILKSPEFVCSSFSARVKNQLSGRAFPIIQASKAREAPIVKGVQNRKIKMTAVQKPSQAFDEELRLQLPSNAFVLEYVIHAKDRIRGSHCMEVKLQQVDVAWPFMEDLQLVSDIILTYSQFANVDFVSPFDLDEARKTWFFVNVILERGQLILIRPESESFSSLESPITWYPTVLASWERLRIGYDWGGRQEVALLINAVGMKLALASDMKLAVLQRSWTLRKHSLDLHTIVSSFNASISWSTRTYTGSPSDDFTRDSQEYISPVPSTAILVGKDSTSPQQFSEGHHPTVAQRKQNLSAGCSLLKLQFATGSAMLVQSFLNCVCDLACLQTQTRMNFKSVPQHQTPQRLERCLWKQNNAAELYSPVLPSAMSVCPTSTPAIQSRGKQSKGQSVDRHDVQPYTSAEFVTSEDRLHDYSRAELSSVRRGNTSPSIKPCPVNVGAVVPIVYSDFSVRVPFHMKQLSTDVSFSNIALQQSL